jgi:glucokinase-like ROK family protein
MKGYLSHKDFKLRTLNIIRNTGPSTKQAIASKLGINITTITSLINKLYKEYKILVVSGVDDSTGGRKPKLYQINKKFGYVIGLDIGGENIRVIITDILGNIISSLRDKINSEKSKEEIISKILSMMDSLIIKSKISKEKILGIGMSISGIINTESGYIIFCPNIEGFKDFHVKKIIEEKTKVQVFIDDSVRCMAIAEKRYGIAKSYNNFIFVSLGKGIGIGVYIDGKIYRGSMGLAGELGHITVSENGPICNCGNRGCLEAIASSDGIIRRVTEGMKKGIVTSLSSAINSNFDNLTVEIIAKAAKDGDKFAYYIINRTGEYVGIAIAAALNLFGSDLIVIGGGVSESGDILLSAIKRTVKTRALDVISKKVAIIKTQLDDNIAALGAATNLIDTLFDNCYEQNILKGV